MSEEKLETQATQETEVKNPSTKAEDKNVPYDRFAEVNQAKNDLAGQVGKLQAQIDKMNENQKQQQQAKLVEDGKLQEVLGIVSKERDTFKTQAEQWNQYQADKRESLMSNLTDDTDKSIAEGLSDLNKLETYVNKVTNVNAPSTSSARATTGKAGEMGGYSSYEEWATKDPKGYKQSNQTNSAKGIAIGYGD